MKRLLSIIAIVGLLLAAMVPTFSASGNAIEKVVFRNMNSELRFPGIGGIRFYNDTTMIDSGDTITSTLTSGETEMFLVTASVGYSAPYNLPRIVDTSLEQAGNYVVGGYWLAPENSKDEQIVIDFKTPQDITKIEFVPLPNPSDTSLGLTEPFVIDVYTTNGTMTSYDINPISENNTVQSLIIDTPKLTFDLDATAYELNAGDTIDVDIVLSNATDIYAEDFTVQYDTNAFELMSSALLDDTAHRIYHTEETAGEARYIVASNGAIYGITGNSKILKLTFQAKNYDGESEIKVLSGLVADLNGNEFVPECLGKIFTLTGQMPDVNGTDTFTLGDLAIASHLISSTSENWGTFTPDVNTSGTVDFTDLSEIVAMIIK